MGLNTTVLVLNDALEQIENDPKFGRKLSEAIKTLQYQQQTDVSAGSFVNAAAVIETHHADVLSVVAIGGNHAQVLSNYAGGYTSDPLEILARPQPSVIGWY